RGRVQLSARSFLQRLLSRSLGRWLNPRPRGPIAPPAPLETVLVGDDSPAALARLLCGRDNPAREAALPRYLQYRGIAFTRHRFTRPQARGDTFAVELGEGPRVLVLCAHHDAIPGSPGANDNAAAVGILLHLIPRLPSRIARGWRVRLLFPAAEALDYLGARAYVEDTALGDVAGVLSLELCGIGDTVALWDADEATPFLGGVTGALESIGLARETGYHVVGRIPMFGSDHPAFSARAIPAPPPHPPGGRPPGAPGAGPPPRGRRRSHRGGRRARSDPRRLAERRD